MKLEMEVLQCHNIQQWWFACMLAQYPTIIHYIHLNPSRRHHRHSDLIVLRFE